MRAFMILAFVVAVSARPEAGYNYNAPNRQQVGGSGFGGSAIGTSSFNSGSVIGLSGSGGNYNGGAASGGFSSGGSYNGANYNGANYNSQSNTGSYTGQLSSGGFSSGGSSGGFGGGASLGGFSGGASSGGFSSGVSSGGFATGAQQTLIQKHIYVHVPPPEPEVTRPQQQIQAGVAQKHYKIIFIKAPSPPTPSAAQIALSQQSQEKTIVYVLVKKPDEIGDIALPTIAPTQPSKPEVYFIKYKTAHSGSNGGVGISASGTASAVGIGGGQISGGSATSSSSGSSLARSTEYRDDGGGEILAPRSAQLNPHEPSCEELRAMWRYSKRQSRAAEITNEIPTYRDPFAYNVWDPYYPTTRSGGGVRINARYRDGSRPVFGRILHKEPLLRLRDMSDRSRTFGDISRLYGAENRQAASQYDQPRRRVQFRFSGSGPVNQNALTPQKGSFQRLKELVWTERARELAQQRKAEELAARAAVLKEIANGHGYGPQRNDAEPIIREGYETDVLPPSSSSIASSKAVIDERMAENSKSSYPHYNDNSWLSSSSNLMRPSYTRERNRSKLRHGFPDTYYSGSRRDKPSPSSYASSEEE